MTTPFRRSPLNRAMPTGADAFRAGGRRRASMPYRARASLIITPLVKDPKLREVTCLLGDGGAKASSDGGWSFVARPKTSGFTTWEGRLPYVLVVPVVFDGFADDQSVEGPWEALRTIFREGVGPERQPSPVALTGAVPLTGLIWVIQSIEPGEELRRARDTHRVRITATITFMQFTDADVIIASKNSPAKKAAAKKPAASSAGRVYVVKSGDTLVKISERMLGTYKRWTEIAKMNGIRDPRKLKVGQRLKIPS